LDRRQLCEALLSTTGDEGAAHCAKRAKRIFAQRSCISDVWRWYNLARERLTSAKYGRSGTQWSVAAYAVLSDVTIGSLG